MRPSQGPKSVREKSGGAKASLARGRGDSDRGKTGRGSEARERGAEPRKEERVKRPGNSLSGGGHVRGADWRLPGRERGRKKKC